MKKRIMLGVISTLALTSAATISAIAELEAGSVVSQIASAIATLSVFTFTVGVAVGIMLMGFRDSLRGK